MLKYQKTEWADIFRKIKSKGGHTDEDKKETDISAGTDRGTEKKRTRNIIITAVVLVIAVVACYFAMPKNKDLSQSDIF